MRLPSIVKGWLNVNLTSEQLLDKYQLTRDPLYVELLVRKYNRSIFHYLLSQSQPDIAEDILQSTWERVLASLPTQSKNKNVKSWLFTISRHLLVDHIRYRKKWQTIELEENKLVDYSVEYEHQSQSKLDLFNNSLALIPFHQREALILQHEGFSIEQVAIICQVNRETIKSRLRYAKTNLKTLMRAES